MNPGKKGYNRNLINLTLRDWPIFSEMNIKLVGYFHRHHLFSMPLTVVRLIRWKW